MSDNELREPVLAGNISQASVVPFPTSDATSLSVITDEAVSSSPSTAPASSPHRPQSPKLKPLGRYLRNSLSPFNLAIAEIGARQSQKLNGSQPTREYKLLPPWIWPEYAELKPSVEQVIMENEETSMHGFYIYAIIFWMTVTPILVCANIFWVPANYALLLIIAPPAMAMVLLVIFTPIFLQPVDTMVRVLASELSIDQSKMLDADRFRDLTSTLQTLLITVLTNATILTTQLQQSSVFFSSICIGLSVGFVTALATWYFAQVWMYRSRMLFQAWEYFQKVRTIYNTRTMDEEVEGMIQRIPDWTNFKRFIWFLPFGGGKAWKDSNDIVKGEAAV